MLRLVLILLLTLCAVGYANLPEGEEDTYIIPADGPVTSVSGYREPPVPGASSNHKGIDIGGNLNDPVYAAMGGVVEVHTQTDANGNLSGYGKYVVIRHANGTTTLYGHLNDITVADGEYVQQGEQIGKLGNTGTGSGAHLHFGISGANPYGDQLTIDGQNWDHATLGGFPTTTYNGRTVPLVSANDYINADGSSSIPLQAANTSSSSANNEENSGEGGTPSVPEVAPVESEFDLENGDFGSFEDLLPRPDEWIDATANIIGEEGFNLGNALVNLSMVLLFAGFVYSLVNAMYYYQGDQIFHIFGRLIVASGLILGADPISEGLMFSWTGIYVWMTEWIVTPATDQLKDQIVSLAPSLTSFAVSTAALDFTAAITPELFGVDFIEEIAESMAGVSRQATIALTTVMFLMAGLYGTYFLSVYISGMTMVLAAFLLPVLAAFLILPGSGSWFMRWGNMVVLSLVTIAVLPIFLNIAITFGLNKPIVKVNEAGVKISEQMDLFRQTAAANPINVASATNQNGLSRWWNSITGWKEYTDAAIPAFTQIKDNMVILIFEWVFALVLTGLMVLALGFLLQQLPGLIAGIVGGSAGGSAALGAGAGAIVGASIASMASGAGGSGGAITGAAAQSAASDVKALPGGIRAGATGALNHGGDAIEAVAAYTGRNDNSDWGDSKSSSDDWGASGGGSPQAGGSADAQSHQTSKDNGGGKAGSIEVDSGSGRVKFN